MITTKAIRRPIHGVAFRLAGLASVILASAAFPTSTWAKSDFVITPTRLVIADGKTDSQFQVLNTGDEPLQFSLALTSLTMRDDGVLVPLLDVQNPLSAAPYMLVAPRRTRLLPGEVQVFRLIVRTPKEPGEYRSHLSLRVATSPDAVTQYAVTMPVMVRSGRVASRVALEVAVHSSGKTSGRLQASIQLARSGEASSYGDLRYQIVLPSGVVFDLGSRKGLAIYSENAGRKISVTLPLPAAALRPGARFVVTYVDTDNDDPVRVSVPLFQTHLTPEKEDVT